MFFLPFSMDINRQGIPVITFFVCIICIGVFAFQEVNHKQRAKQIYTFCEVDLHSKDKTLVYKVAPQSDMPPCYALFERLRNAQDPDKELVRLLAVAKTKGNLSSKKRVTLARKRLTELSKRYNRWTPKSLTQKLKYNPKENDIISMFTSKFAHSSVMHIFGNLLIFYIFAASVEMILGSLGFLAFFLMTSVATSLTYSAYLHKLQDTSATIGLSGVVAAMVVALAIMIPKAKVRCFFTIMLVYRKTFGIPAIFLASWYFFWDFYNMSNYGLSTGVNYIAHLSGAACGLALGVFYWLFKQDVLRDASRHY